ncbi:MAG: chemotaxis protein CheB [Rubrimonas sp.]
MSDGPAAFVAGFGASAGGLEALISMARRLPAATGGAFVVAQHVAPAHKSLLRDLLARRADLQVVELTAEPIPPAPDVIYVTPAGADVALEGGLLTLRPASLAPAAPKPSIDRLFASLAAELGDRAVAAVLSGTGADGAAGLRAVHDAGGVTIVQDPDGAKFSAMPEAALGSGCVDLILPPEEIGALFDRVVGRSYAPGLLRAANAPEDLSARLIAALRRAQGLDFSAYKPAMLRRRVEKRMDALGCGDLESYVALACESPAELRALNRALLISVTSFFRDPEEFEALRPRLAGLLAQLGDAALRIWVPGCATGEEVWSIAALRRGRVRILGTDVDEAALAAARRGLYSAADVAQAPEALGRQFAPAGEAGGDAGGDAGGGWASPLPLLRDAATFARHDVLTDPPCGDLGLISCRNLLIYLTHRAQRGALEQMRVALAPHGLLFLGKADSAAAHPDAFRAEPGAPRILRPVGRAPGPAARASARARAPAPRTVASAPTPDLFESLAEASGDGAALLSADLRVLRRFGESAEWLRPAPAEIGGAAPELRACLAPRWRAEGAALVERALADRRPVETPPRPAPGDPASVETLRAAPLTDAARGDAFALLSLRRSPARAARAREAALADALAACRRSLDRVGGEAEAAQEALRTLNEEMQTANEELQSTNQELQTANQELQAANEEMTTVNEELELRSQQLNDTAAHLEAVLREIASPVLVADRMLRISGASAAAQRLFPGPPGAEAPALDACPGPAGFPPLAPLFREAMARRAPIGREIDCPDSAWSMTIAPFEDASGGLAGAVAIFADQTERRAREARLRDAMEKLAASNAELERFSYVASHDLREPVRTLAGFAECLGDPALALEAEERAELLACIRDNARRLGEIIDSLLAFSRIDREVQIEDVDLDQIAREALTFLARGIADCGAHVEVGPLPTVRASRVHMRQLFQNLVGNALKFRSERPCRVRIGARRAQGAHLVTVEDNGVGVPEAARDVIFEVFRRLHPRSEVEGAGLGLSICRKIVEQYGGRIWCESNPTGGAAFRFTLPSA